MARLIVGVAHLDRTLPRRVEAKWMSWRVPAKILFQANPQVGVVSVFVAVVGFVSLKGIAVTNRSRILIADDHNQIGRASCRERVSSPV